MNRWLLGAGIAVALSACATAPKKSASEAVPLPEAGSVARAGLPPTHRKRSPYAPAQEDLSKRGNYTRGGLYAPGVKDTAPDDPLHDVDQIPEPDVIDEPRSRYGNRSPYTVLGQAYHVRGSADGYVEQGLASYYGNKFHGRRTSNLEVYDMYAFTAAHKSLPLPSFARVTNLDNGKSVVVRINDRGPFHAGRVIDLSYAAAVKLGYRNKGTARVEVRGLSAGENARHGYDAVASAASGASAPTSSSTPPTPTAPALRARAAAPGLPPGVRIATGKPTSLSAPKLPAARAGSEPARNTAMDKLVGLLPVAAANAGERQPQQLAQAKPASVGSTGSPAASVAAVPGTSPAAPPPAAAPGQEWRFNMQQDGKAMTADEFDAWMKSRRARVATGKSGKPDPRTASATATVRTPQVAAATVAAEVPRDGSQVILQVASFGNSTNAGHALNMLQKADISARIQDALVNGRQFWRVRVGPVDAARAPDIAARVVALGFDQPHRVRE